MKIWHRVGLSLIGLAFGMEMGCGHKWQYDGEFGIGSISPLPDQSAIIYSAAGVGQEPSHLYSVSWNGQKTRQLTADVRADSDVCVAPNGKFLVFVRQQGNNVHIWRANVDGTGQRQLTFGPECQTEPSISPHGDRIAYTVSDPVPGSTYALSMTTPAGNFSYSYDGAGRQTGLTNPFGEGFSWTYANNSWLQTQTLANGVTTASGYDASGELTSLVSRTSGGATLSKFSGMGYNGAGDRNSLTASLPSAAFAYSGQTSYTYDARDQLTQEQSTRAGGYTDNQTYDGVTNGTTTGPGNPTQMRGNAHLFNSDNQDVQNKYDGNGNPAVYKGNSLAFDPENRMTAYGSVLSAGYTDDGLRAWKQNSQGRTYFLYDGETSVCELSSSGSVTAVDTFGLGHRGLLSRHTGNGSVFYTFDANGNVTERQTSAGTVASADVEDGFGARTTSNTTGDPFGFDGHDGGYTDGETGMVLFTHRYYDVVTGRWLTRDPMSYGGGIDLYGYACNNPVTRIDPSGTVARDSPIGGPQSYDECVALADLAWERCMDQCKAFKGIRAVLCRESCSMVHQGFLADCRAQEILRDVNDICHNRNPAREDQPIVDIDTGPPSFNPFPIFGPIPVPVSAF